MDKTENILEIKNLRKRYKGFALDGISLSLPQGYILGLIGPNGAGKTTTIRILLGLLRASSGRALVLDQDVWRAGPRLRAEVGYLPGDIRLYDHLTGRATLRFFDAARGGRGGPEIARLAARFDLDLDVRVRNYSRGMKQKLGLIQALMHRPQLLMLDEPTVSLDPLVRRTLSETLREAASEGRTVLFSSHTLSEVEELCDRVAILRDGRLVEQDEITALRRRAVRHVEIRFRRAAGPPPPPAGLRVAHRADNLVIGAWSGPVEPLIAWLARCPVEDVTIGQPDLQDLFMAYYAKPAGGESA